MGRDGEDRVPVESVEERSHHPWPLRVRGAQAGAAQAPYARFASAFSDSARSARPWRGWPPIARATAHAGIRFHVEQALVRDRRQGRAAARNPRASRPIRAAFLRGNYDVVVDALDAVEPARTLVARLLGRGTSVVTANKALVAEHGAQPRVRLRPRTAPRSASRPRRLSAVPFLGTLADRPLVASVDRVLAIVNGTSNYLLTSLAEPGASFESGAGPRAGSWATPNPIRRAISTASMPPTSCCC